MYSVRLELSIIVYLKYCFYSQSKLTNVILTQYCSAMYWLLCLLCFNVSVLGEAVKTNATSVNFLLVVANPDSSSLVPAVNQVLKEINMRFNFKMKYRFFIDDEVRN